MTQIRIAKDSSGLLLARFTDATGAVVTNTSPAGTTCTITLTATYRNTKVLNNLAMTYDGALTQLDPADGVVKTGWWKYQLTPANTAIQGAHKARAVAVNGAVQRAKEWDVWIGADV